VEVELKRAEWGKLGCSDPLIVLFSIIVVVHVCPVDLLQLNLNNRPLSQMLKSTVPVESEEQDPLEFYEQHTSQIEVSTFLPQLTPTTVVNLSNCK
jgi:hypothetical protein